MRRVVVVPHGELHRLPFHALHWDGSWLSDAYEVLLAPSAAAYRACRGARPSATGATAVFGVPHASAPSFEDECRRVAQAVGRAKLYLREDATFERLREEAGRARVLHVATHGMFRPDRPTLSCVRLADAWLNLYDVYDLDVRADLVVLSACETGLVEAGRGDEAFGLLRGFLYAGAPRVLASRWRVNDRSTASFMSSFYGALKEGATYEASLRRARCAVRESRPHPYHWAAFAFVGDARGRYEEEVSVRKETLARRKPRGRREEIR